ncbi:crosslink repair DNA glycosylase YcaQ family protein [Roseisolibacter sp. H3M3-2]|uniref:DNA glycosylase AlkZ-like family protein n=1 Tax=Roseisolibacter sp. H3M3-2 TaxID=3031323 RepID=UPI0023DAF457|nr:crosslink repair DNA glycosylase YcaQ family protein [Roseisolibacter sp. H3M3-2]MDF1502827.1 crosslink repair DNA glycosylase YcaQ family protein [Roseisolibacter sp. H3M3-2]
MDLAKLRAWWWARQGLDGALDGAEPGAVLARSGWARSVGGVGPYLTLFARAGTTRAAADAAVAAREIHELPAARGCTYVVPREDFALALAVGDGWREPELRTAEKLGVTRDEVERLCEAVLGALAGSAALEPDAIRAAVGDRARSLGDAGKKKGLSTTLPLALGQLQARGEIRRVPVNGRLDQQRYAYVRWDDGPRTATRPAPDDAVRELARRFFRWVGPATMAEWRFFSGLGVKAARESVAALDLRPAEPGSDRLLLPEDLAAWRDFAPPGAPAYALVSSLDAITATRREVATLVDDADRARAVLVDDGRTRDLGALSDLPSHAILERGRLAGLWEFDADAGTIAWATLDGRRDAGLEAAVARTERWVRDELGDARSFSLDSPKSRAPRLRAIRAMDAPR